MLHTDRGLGRRLQLQQGLVWLAAAQGDPYAALLRGLDTDPREHWSRLAEQPLSRSATGAWVTARHAVARAALAEPALRAAPLLDGVDAHHGSAAGADAAPHAVAAWDRALDGTAGALDVVAVARDAAIGTLAGLWGLDGAGQRELSAALAPTEGVLDAPFCPQSLAGTRRIADGVAALRSLLPADRLPIALAGVPVATDLVANAVERYAALAAGADPAGAWERLGTEAGHAARVVSETLRLAPPVQLHAAVADAPCDLADRRIEAGDQVVVVLGAAHRDPEAFADPDRFDPDRPADRAALLLPGALRAAALPFAVLCAEEGLRRLAAHRPRPAAAGPAVRRTAAPVSRSLVAYPVSTA